MNCGYICRDPDAFAYAIKRSCENKAEVVSQDEKESGLRATLNLGHTFGHVSFGFLNYVIFSQILVFLAFSDCIFWSQAIETSYGYGHWLHGEAVAAGTVLLFCL